MWKVVVVALLALAAVGCGASRYAVATWQYIQAERVALGLQPLEWDDSLLPLADERAHSLAENLTIAHDSEYFDTHLIDHAWVCEINGRQPLIDPGQGKPVLDAIGYGWIHNPPHAFCALGADFKRAAIACYVGTDDWVYCVTWLTD